ncbi:MAG: VWA domain-containing protein [Acidobacteria bacterium]|nr:VWA domain-containing protein [Acidobacteriota bacterium]
MQTWHAHFRVVPLLTVTVFLAGFSGALRAQDAAPAASTPAQTPAQPSEQTPVAGAPAAPASPQGPVIKAESKLVIVDAVVTDKKGSYVHDLQQGDFKVYEDNKEQQVSAFSSGVDAAIQASKSIKRYLVLFFDNSSMAMPDQIQARAAAAKFIDANAGPDRQMAVAEFSGTLRITQNFTVNAEVLQAAVRNAKSSAVASNTTDTSSADSIGGPSLLTISGGEAEFGARTMLLAMRTLARNLQSVPGRKMLVLFSAGFPLDSTTRSELLATIDACNKSNVAVYSLDVRGLMAPAPGGMARNGVAPISSHGRAAQHVAEGRLVLASYSPTSASFEPQHPGGGGGGGTGGGGKTGGGGTTGGTGGTGTGGKTGGTGTTGTPGGTRSGGGTTPTNYNPYNNNPNFNPFVNAHNIIPTIPTNVSTNQEVLAMLADGTGGFTIFNTNDLVGGLDRISKEGNEFYILGYIPHDSPEGSCHSLKVKMNHSGFNVRSRTGYCNVRPENPLAGKPVEKQLEARAVASGAAGSIHGNLESPYFYTGPNVARVNLAMEIPADSLKFDKDKGKYHSTVNVLGIAYKPDGSVGAKFSDTIDLDLEKDELKAFQKEAYHYQNQFDAVPGDYKLTVVLSGGGDAFGKFETPLHIDPYDGKTLSLGGIVMTNSATRVADTPAGLDSVLLEDHTPLIVKGLQVVPSATNRFKKTDNVIMYTEVYEPLLTGENPPKVAVAYHVFNRATNKDILFTGAMPADDFIQKGSPVIAVGLKVAVKDLPPGGYRLLVQAVDGAKHNAPNRTVDFDVVD